MGRRHLPPIDELIELLPDDEHVIAIEDTLELRIDRDNCVRFEARGIDSGSVTVRDLVRYALRRNPFLGCRPFAGVCYRRAKADSPLPHDGPLDPLPAVGAGRVAPTISCEWRNR